MIKLNFRENGQPKEIKFGYDRWMGRFGCGGDSSPRDPINELQICLAEISKSYPHCDYKLSLVGERITQPVLSLLIQLLNQPFSSQSSSSTTEPTAITGNETTKWEAVEFTECRLAVPDSTPLQTMEDEEYCSPDDIQIFVSIVAVRTELFFLRSSPEILHALYDVPKHEFLSLRIDKLEFSALDCTRLVNLLQRNERPPVALSLDTFYIEDPLVLAEGLINIKALTMDHAWLWPGKHSPSPRPNYPSLGDMLVGGGGNCIMQRLLQSPFSQLECLCLMNGQMEDRHFIAIVDMLPTSQLETLVLWFVEGISWQGILAFAHQLPRITCLKSMDISFNKLYAVLEEEPEEDRLKGLLQECRMALTRGMHDNYSIEKLRIPFTIDTQDNPISYFTDLNHAARQVLVTSKPVPAGLWPWILERAGTKCFRDCIPEIQESRRVDAIFFLLQNCPAFLVAIP